MGFVTIHVENPYLRYPVRGVRNTKTLRSIVDALGCQGKARTGCGTHFALRPQAKNSIFLRQSFSSSFITSDRRIFFTGAISMAQFVSSPISLHTSSSLSFTPSGLWSSLQVDLPIPCEAAFVYITATLRSHMISCRIHGLMRV